MSVNISDITCLRSRQ